jgi:hypothetical protein
MTTRRRNENRKCAKEKGVKKTEKILATVEKPSSGIFYV